jgi:pyrroline-5-carboxylate reductase
VGGTRKLNISVIGAGIIGGAVAEALSPLYSVTATRRNMDRLNGLTGKGIRVTTDNQKAAEEADLIILSVKPVQVVPVLRKIAAEAQGKTIISFAAAISLDILQQAAPGCRFVRAMTNIAVSVRKGYTLFSPEPGLPDDEMRVTGEILGQLGEIQRVDEQYLDVLTAMSGSGPAYIFTVVESMIYGALREGLPRDLALKAAAHTAIGASCLLLESGKHPSELKDMVMTPGGVTIDGIYELEESRIRTAFMKAISAASARARVLSDEARSQARQDIE